MEPKTPSKFAADLVISQSPQVVSGMIGDIERMLERYAAFEQWIDEHSICEISRQSREECRCKLCSEDKTA